MLLDILETVKDLNPEIQNLSDNLKQVNDNSIGEILSEDIASLARFTEGISGIAEYIKNAETDGLALMSGISGTFSGLQGLFGGEAGSDMSELLGGLGGVGAGVAGLLTGNPLEGITGIISGLPSLIDGLTESTQEGYVKQLSNQGFNDTYSQELLDKMSAVSDRLGDKSFGMKAYIEDLFKETTIDTEEEFTRLSDLLNESIGEYIAQGHTTDEAYEKFGDELAKLTSAQEKYGFETVASLDNMIEVQKTQTAEGRIAGLSGALGGYGRIISGLEKQLKLTPDFKLSGASVSGIAGSLVGTYNQLLNQGMGAGEAVDAVKPLLTQYSAMAEKQGWDLSKVPGFNKLSSYFGSLDKASGALDMLQGMADVVKSLSGSGLMDQASLESQGALGLDVMQQLKASGLNETQVLQQMGGWLQSMQQASEKWGLSLSPEIQALISKAEEKGVLPEDEKPLGDIIAEGIETGFADAIELMDDYFGGLIEYSTGGTVPGANGEKRLVWAHAGEYIGYPDELQGFSGISLSDGTGGLSDFIKNLISTLSTTDAGFQSIATTLQRLGGGAAFDLNKLSPNNISDFPAYLDSVQREREFAQIGRELSFKDSAEKEISSNTGNLQLAQTIENRVSLVVNDREFVQTLKSELYNQIKEDSKRGMIKIHSKAVEDF
jgi:hypothetical protein